jgi:hypothetical protein
MVTFNRHKENTASDSIMNDIEKFQKEYSELKHPQKKDFTTTFYYHNGKCIAIDRNNEFDVLDDQYTPSFIAEVAVKEKIVDGDAYKRAMQEYRVKEGAIYTNFKFALYEDLGISRNSKREKLFAKAWDRGHSSGFYEVYNTALDLVDLIE